MADSSGKRYTTQHRGLASRAQASGRTFYQQRAYEEAATARSEGFDNRRQWLAYRAEHAEQLEDLRRKDSDVAKAWRQYEGDKPLKGNLQASVDFTSARERIGRVQRSKKIKGAAEKKKVTNAIMHEYMRKHHKRMMAKNRERIVWDIEGETP